jgi:hypothetical protein
MRWDRARRIADALLYEGYVLYPYRASSVKNRLRWSFGVVMPPAYAAAHADETAETWTESLVEPGRDPVLSLRVRFLQVQARSVETAADGRHQAVPRLETDDGPLVPWEEGVPREWDAPPVPLRALLGRARSFPYACAGGREVEAVCAEGRAAGRVVRERWPLAAEVTVAVTAVEPLWRVRVSVRNTGDWPRGRGEDRPAAACGALVSAHVLLAVDDGAFVSLLDPPGWAAPAAAGCAHRGAWPVLVGAPGARDEVLASPIMLYDHPAVADESPADLCDATEIDEILMLRIRSLTDDEKREARATDPRAREIVDRADALPGDALLRLHGGRRDTEAATGETDAPAWIEVDGHRLARGSRVRLAPRRRADAMDLFLAGRDALVRAVLRDVDGRRYLAVTVDADPAADLLDETGRYFYFDPDEVEPLAAGPRA